MTLLVTRATLKEYGNLAGQLSVARPDVLVTRVATRAVTMSSAPLKGYRRGCPFTSISHPFHVYFISEI